MNGCIGGIKEKAGAKSGVLASMPSVATASVHALGQVTEPCWASV